MKTPVTLICLIACATFTACKPPADVPATSKEQKPPLTFDEGPGETVAPPELNVLDKPSPAVVSIKPNALVEPDWEALKKELIEKHAKSFVPPAPGDKITLILTSGARKPAVLEKVEGDTVYVELDAGNVGYPRSALHAESQVQLFQLAHAQYEAAKEWRETRGEFERKKKEQEIAEAKASGEPMVPVNDPARNGAVWQVVEYLREYVRNPETIRFKKWGQVQKVEAGYRVSLQYEFSTETMKNAVTHKWFLMDHSGKVYRTALYKEQ